MRDEAPMMHRNTFEAMDKSFRDTMEQIGSTLQKVPFGGKIMVFGGDFRQVAPVIQRASRAVIGAASLRLSQSIWPHMQQHCLTIKNRVDNMGEHDKAEHLAFAALLLSLARAPYIPWFSVARPNIARRRRLLACIRLFSGSAVHSMVTCEQP